MLTVDEDFCRSILVPCGADLSSAAVYAFIFHGDVWQHQSAPDHSDLSRFVFMLFNGMLAMLLDTQKHVNCRQFAAYRGFSLIK